MNALSPHGNALEGYVSWHDPRAIQYLVGSLAFGTRVVAPKFVSTFGELSITSCFLPGDASMACTGGEEEPSTFLKPV